MNNISFGHKIIVDCGASKKHNGSLKISVLSDETNKEIYKSNGVVCENGFKKDEDFLNGLAKGIADSYDKSKSKIEQLNPTDKELTGLVIYSPGPTINNFSPIMQNLLKVGTNQSLTNIDFKDMPPILESLMANKGINISNKFKVIATNDMIGAGTSIAKKLVQNPEFKEGYEITFMMAGGGLGVGQIEHMGDNVLIKTSEIGGINLFGTDETPETHGACVRALIKNFSNNLLSNQDTEKLIKIGNAKIATQYPIDADSKEAEALMKTGLFKNIGIDGTNQLVFKNISEDAHKNASKEAINKFIESISIIGANKIAEGTNGIIVTGPLAKGIKASIEKNPELFDNKNFNELIKDKIDSLLDDSGKTMASLYNFKIITDIDVKNNTDGGNLILQGNFVGKEKRGNWLSVPISEI